MRVFLYNLPVIVNTVSDVKLKGEIAVTWAILQDVKNMLTLDADAFTLHDETSNDWPAHEAGLLDGAVWIFVKSAFF